MIEKTIHLAFEDFIWLLSNPSSTTVSGKEWAQISNLIVNPPEPNQKLMELLSRKEY